MLQKYLYMIKILMLKYAKYIFLYTTQFNNTVYWSKR